MRKKWILCLILCSVCTGCGIIKPPVSGETADIESSLESSTEMVQESTTESTEENRIEEDRIEENRTEEKSTEGIDITAFVELPLIEYSADLTGDGNPEKITVMILGQAEDDLTVAEDLVTSQGRRVSVTVWDGDKELYNRIYSVTHIENGQLSLISREGKAYMLESDMYEHMGEATYQYEVFDFQGGQRRVVDSGAIHFCCGQDSVQRTKERGEEVQLREDVVPMFQTQLEQWFESGKLLVSCDITAFIYDAQEVMIGTEENSYEPKDYYDTVWVRQDEME